MAVKILAAADCVSSISFPAANNSLFIMVLWMSRQQQLLSRSHYSGRCEGCDWRYCSWPVGYSGSSFGVGQWLQTPALQQLCRRIALADRKGCIGRYLSGTDLSSCVILPRLQQLLSSAILADV
jgi:hypothetical protein